MRINKRKNNRYKKVSLVISTTIIGLGISTNLLPMSTSNHIRAEANGGFLNCIWSYFSPSNHYPSKTHIDTEMLNVDWLKQIFDPVVREAIVNSYNRQCTVDGGTYIRSAYQLSNHDLLKITQLVYSGSGDEHVVSLGGVDKYLPNLQSIDLQNVDMHKVDLTPIAKLPKLGCLNLSNDKITDVTKLSHSRCLEWLYLNNNRITDLSNLKLNSLTSFEVNNNQIKDIANIQFPTIVWTKFNNQNIIENKEVIINKELKQQIIDIPISLFTANRDNNGFYYPLPVGHNVMIGNGPHDFFLNENKEVIMGNYHSNIFVPYDVGHKSYSVDKNGSYVVNNGFRGFTYILTPDRERPAFLKFYYKDRSGKVSGVYNINFSWTEKNISDENAVFDSRKITNLDSRKTAGSMTNTAPISENQVSSQAENHDSVATPAKPSVTTSDKTAGSMTNTAPISENPVSSQAGNHDSVATPAKPSVTTSDKTAGSMTNTAPISENQVSSQAGNHDSVATPAKPSVTTSDKTAGSMTNTAPISENQVSSQAGNHDSVATPAKPSVTTSDKTAGSMTNTAPISENQVSSQAGNHDSVATPAKPSVTTSDKTAGSMTNTAPISENQVSSQAGNHDSVATPAKPSVTTSDKTAGSMTNTAPISENQVSSQAGNHDSVATPAKPSVTTSDKTAGSMTNTAPISENQVSSQAGNHDSVATPAKPSVTTSDKTAGSMTNTAPISENQVSSQAGNHDSVATPAKPSVTTSDKTAGSMTNTAPISENQVSSQAGNHDSVATPAKPSVTTSDKTAGSMTNTAPISENQVSSQAGNHDSVATPAMPTMENTTHQVVTASSTVPSSIAKPMAVKPESSNGISSTGVSVNRQTNGLITSNQVAPTKVKLNIYLNVHKKYTKKPLKKMKIEKIRNLKGQIVYIKKALNIYSKNNFAIKYRLHEFKKIGLKYGPKFLVLGLTHSSKHSPRYKVVLINVRTGRPQHGYKYTYGYITGKKSYVEPLYHNSKVKKARILSNKITEYKDIHFTKKVRNIKHGRLLKIKAVKRLVRKHRVTFLLQLSNHHYITANKKWVAKVK